MAIQTMTKITDPINGTTKEKDPHLYDYDKVVHSKDDMKGVNRGLRRLNYKITGKDAFDENGNHKGFKCSAKCRPEVAEGHNRRNENWVKKLDHVAKNGDYEIWMDYKNLDSAYKEIFGEALEEYNKTQRSNRRIKNYLTHIQNDKRQGSMKKSAKVDNSRKLLIKLVGTTKGISWEEGTGLTKSLQASFRPLIANAVKTNLPYVIKNEEIDLLEIDEKLDIISENLRAKILPGFEEYGLTIPQFYVTNIVLPEDDPNFKRIRDLHTITLQTRMLQAEATVKTAKAQSETMYRTAEEQSKAAIEAARRQAELERQTTETEIAKREAERRLIEAQAEAQAQKMAGFAEAEVMHAKGYNQKDVLQAEVQMAFAEGIGNMGPAISAGGGSIMGDMLGLGVGMAAANAMAPQINGMMQGFNPQMQPMSAVNDSNSWDCTCGNKGIVGNFCNNCGSKKLQPVVADTWDCSCGQKGITGNFCNNCGSKRPVAPTTWDCSCGNKGISGNFCNNCGARKPEGPVTWNCSCGKTGIIGNFCDNCGNRKGE